MAGFVAGVMDPDQWAWSPGDLSRIIGDQLDEPVEVNAAGRTPWVAA